MQKFWIDRRSVVIGLLIGALPLALAYGAQYWLGLAPCKLCIYQRIPYGIIVCASIVALLGNNRSLDKAYYMILMLSLLSSIAISVFHVGVENNWFHYNSTCVFDQSSLSSFEQYKMMINQADLVPCNSITASLLGLSMAVWNVIYSSMCSLLLYMKLIKF